MTNKPITKCFVGSFAIALLAIASVKAQPVPTAAPPLPGEEIYNAVDPDGFIAQESIPVGSTSSTSMGEETGYKTLSSVFSDGSSLTDNLAMHTNYPATLESTGTWLRRGLWYADLDAVIMTRTWDNDGIDLVFDAAGGINRSRRIEESSPDADGSARLALGRFLFRDQKNRDHTAEMIVLGGAEWVDDGAITQAPGGFLLASPLLTANGSLPSFTGADEMSYTYSSHFNSFEWNYNVTQRMRKDQMQLGPDGEWTRRAANGWTQSYLAGLRYFELQEDFDWLASGFDGTDSTGEMNVRSSNNLFGVQFGHGLTYETNRWNISVFSKHGMYVNDARTTSNLSFDDITAGGTFDGAGFANEGHENSLSYLLQAGITGRYHLRPNFSLRVGYEFLYTTGLALAPNDISFDANQNLAGVSGDVFHRGFTFGSEYYW